MLNKLFFVLIILLICSFVVVPEVLATTQKLSINLPRDGTRFATYKVSFWINTNYPVTCEYKKGAYLTAKEKTKNDVKLRVGFFKDPETIELSKNKRIFVDYSDMKDYPEYTLEVNCGSKEKTTNFFIKENKKIGV